MIPTEAQEAETLVAYLRVKGYKFMHIPSETGGTPEAMRRAVRMKRQGVSRGFPDYLIIANGTLLAVELKRRKGSRTSPEQLEWIKALQEAHVHAQVCAGYDEAVEFIESVVGFTDKVRKTIDKA